MTVYYVHHTRSNTSPFDTWAKAATSVENLPALTSADTVYVASSHSETKTSAALVLVGETDGEEGGPTYISVDEAGDPEPPAVTDYEDMVTGGGNISAGSGQTMTISSSMSLYGLNLEMQGLPQWNMTDKEYLYCNDCTISLTANDMQLRIQNDGLFIFENCTFKTNNVAADNANYLHPASGSGHVRFVGCTWTECSYKQFLFSYGAYIGTYEFIGCDLSAFGQSASGGIDLLQNSTFNLDIIFRGCVMPTTSFSLPGTALNDCSKNYISLFGSDGTNNDREAHYHHTIYGEMETWGGANTSRRVYRSGGFKPPDQTNEICYRVEAATLTLATANAPFVLPPMSIWNDTTAATVTVTVEMLVDRAAGAVAAVNDDDVWLMVGYYDSASDTQLKMEWSRPSTILTAATELTTSSETWTTTDAQANTKKYKIAHTTGSTVGRKGPILVYAYIGDLGTNDNIYIDPMLTLS